ncbi:MAG: META domain-containing protein [Cyclobacteriaceae bacterium]|nr:META domain-containing protein [Cyclobacteriaceae bacterium]
MNIADSISRPLAFYLALAGLMASCTSRLYVAPRQGDCTGLAEQKCLLIRHDATGNWIIHQDKITGFDYEPGFSYLIKVKKEHVKKPPPGTSSIRYSLLETIEKKDVTSDMEKSDLTGKDWKLAYMIENGTTIQIENKIPVLRFSNDGEISGNGGCNNFFGSYSLLDRTIRIGQVGATKMMCADGADLEQSFLKVLSGELRGLFSNDQLILSSDGGNRLVFEY